MRDQHQVLKACFDPTVNALRVTGSAALDFNTITSSGGDAEADLEVGSNFFIELTENTTIDFANETDGRKFMVVVKQDAGGANSLAWTDTILWEGGVEPTVSQTGDAVDAFTFVYVDPLSAFLGSVIQDFQAPP